MAEFKISRIRYTWRGNWTASTVYQKDDVIFYGGASYVCIRKHTASLFASDQTFIPTGETNVSPAWTKMTDGYVFRSTWASSTLYNEGDIVLYGGNLYLCVDSHTSSSTFSANLSDWSLYISGDNFRGNWLPSTSYGVGDLVRYNGIVYECVQEHTSVNETSGIEVEQVSHLHIHNTVVSGEIDYVTFTVVGSDITALYLTKYESVDNVAFFAIQQGSAWTAGEDTAQMLAFSHFGPTTPNYQVGSNVLAPQAVTLTAGNTYTMWIQQTGSNITEYVFSTNPSYIAAGVEIPEDFSGNPASPTTITYAQGKWEIYFSNIQYRGSWSDLTRYRENDLIFYNGTILRCIEGHTSSEPFDDTKWQLEFRGFEFDDIWNTTTYYGLGSVVRYGGYLYYAINANYNILPTDTENWQLLEKATSFQGDWSNSGTYKTGDVVRRGGDLYIALQDTSGDGSTTDYLDESNWEKIATGYKWRDRWQTGIEYDVNDTVVYYGSTYKCNEYHLSSSENYPGDNGSGFEYWDLVIETPTQIGMNDPGDLLTYNLSRTLAGDGSTFGPTKVSIGSDGRVLYVDNAENVVYRSFGSISRVFYVDPTGVDDNVDPERGSASKPWKTVRFACEQADDDFAGNTTVSVTTGKFEEILPIIIPANTVVLGAELRSTVISPNQANSTLSNDSTYRTALLARLSNIMYNLLNDVAIAKSSGNNEDQVSINGVVSSPDAVQSIRDLIDDMVDYIEYYLESTGTLPTITGSNTAETSQNYLNAVTLLDANLDFLKAEAVAYLQTTYPGYSFDADTVRNDIVRYVEAWQYDIIYTGNYRSILEARYYRNTVSGSLTEDMFYCRDATGVRDCTLNGLTGTLSPPNVFDLYRRPTGGIYVSLDPGWGPADERCWITSRSPYIQGVTTIGYACIGQKIDGSLHNGGNKSIVSNDFTQVLSDGIGAWVLNSGRAELVSVFSYYAQVGYLAQNGGIIRGTNGNCSYGNYGAIADGVDATETPQTATVNARNQEAQVSAAFAGDFTDIIQILEWSNAGHGYTQASATIIGSGVNVETVFDEFRDDAVFEARRLDVSDSTVFIGGSGYVVVGNNAQVHATPNGDAIGITLSAADVNEEANYLGMRIILTSGAGTGQYGYITAYNSTTKVAQVARESDGQAGWDHIIPGTPIQIPLDTSTTYRIEPRPAWTAPGFTSVSHELPISLNWSSVVYGETAQTYTGILGSSGSGTVTDAVAVNATFNITRVGRSYTSVTLVNPGAGYADGETVTISGEDLGGLSPQHDISVKVTEISNDSTNSIVSFVYTYNQAISGKFVTLAASSNQGAVSEDGQTWTTFSMPAVGDWKCLTSGNNRFVAIRSDNSNVAAYSTNGSTWISSTMPSSRNWSGVAYGDGIFVAVSSDQNSGAYSTNNGVAWSASTMPTIGDSSFNEWQDIAYGKGKFVAVASSNNVAAVGTYSSGTLSWSGTVMDIIADSSQKNWVSVAYGKNRFVTISSQGDVGYSFDGIVWYPAELPAGTSNWKKVRYGQGVFFAVAEGVGGTTVAATSDDGVRWTTRTLTSSLSWNSVAFGNPFLETVDLTTGKATPLWVAVASGNVVNKIRTGARTLGRVRISAGVISGIVIWEPGSGYTTAPTFTITDPNNLDEVVVQNRLGDGVIADPTWINRGTGYRTASTTVTIIGDGYADIIPSGKLVTISGLERYPGPGTQIIFTGNSQIYTVVTITELGTIDGELNARVRVTPEIKVRDNLVHGTAASLRTKYSQVRITGHDFLDIGTGNFVETNYPDLYATGDFVSAPENEVYEEDGGRVFYTSTDQSGNFRTGELFQVEQATGIVTISSDFFDLSGLTELKLGGIRIGGTGVVIREFSTDPLFIEDSNNVVPTQRAIKAYLANRLSVGGSDIATASFIAGSVKVGPAVIEQTLGGTIQVPVKANFIGGGVSGSIMAQTMFHRSFDTTEI